MRLVLDIDPQILTVQRYGSGELEVGGQRVSAPCILSATQLITDWQVASASELDLAALAPLLALQPSIVLIGTDAVGWRASSVLRKHLETRAVALETMGLGAACRTYNVLAQERRPVVAGLFP
jgi:uncharacterized protein